MQRIVLAGVALVGVAACGGSKSKSAPSATTGDAGAAPLVIDAAPAPVVADAATDDAEPAALAPPDPTADAAGRFAVVREVDQAHTYVDTYEIANGAIRKLTTAHVSDEGMFSHDLIWADPAGPAVFRGGITEREGEELYGTVTGDRFTAVKPKGKGDVLRMVGSTAGEVWLERCAKWNEDNPDEEGCDVRRWYRITPSPATATKLPPLLTVPADVVPAPARPTLKVRKAGTDFVLDCTSGGTTTTLLEGDQVYAAPTWRWLSAKPPIALLAIAYAGSGEGPEGSDITMRMLRDCALDEYDATMVSGPAGRWALPSPTSATDDPTWQIFVRGTVVGKVTGKAVAFAGGAGVP